MNRRFLLLTLIPAFLVALSATPALAAGTELVSVSSSGEQGNDDACGWRSPDHPDTDASWLWHRPFISADGRFVFFESPASNLVAGDQDDIQDVFIRDRLLSTTERVNLSDTGDPLIGDACVLDDVTADGRFIVLGAYHTGDGGIDRHKVLVRDLAAGTNELVSVTISGGVNTRTAVSGSISDDGRLVVFYSEDSDLVPGDTNGEQDVFLRDRLTQTTERVNLSMHGEELQYRTQRGRISADGRFVLFYSAAPNVVPGDTNAAYDVFLRDLQTGAAERVTLGPDGTDRNGRVRYTTISADGRFIAFWSDATNLVPGDTNAAPDVFVEDRLTGTTERVSVSSSGDQQDGAGVPNLVRPVSISNDGRFVAFLSWAHNLVPDDANQTTDIFLRDRLLSTTERVSLTNWGGESGDESVMCDITPDGRWVVFGSRGVLVAEDVNGKADVYVRDRYGFADVPYAHWARLDIEACVAAHVVQGYDPDTYAPEIAVSRAQMAVFISRALAGGDDNVPDGSAEATFDDVPTDHWAYKYIEYCVANDIVQGFDPVTYGPTVTVSRDAMAAFISRAVAGGDDNVPVGPDTATFDDVPTDHWAFKYVEHCVSVDVVQGYHDGYYHPEYTCSRAQMAVFISRAFNIPG